jgi:glycosyltransferase involved in cell wall biosynthesis
LGLENKFVAIYAGIHGVAQGLETIIEAARLLQNQPEIHFLLIGDGPQKSAIANLARQYDLPNITLLPAQPRGRIPDYLSAADAALVPLRNVELFKGALPSKIFDAWACERPVLLSVDGEARQIVKTVGGGIFIPPEDPEATAQAILSLRDHPAGRVLMGARGRQYTVEHYSRRAQAEKLMGILENLV